VFSCLCYGNLTSTEKVTSRLLIFLTKLLLNTPPSQLFYLRSRNGLLPSYKRSRTKLQATSLQRVSKKGIVSSFSFTIVLNMLVCGWDCLGLE
jgi:hypothetical protein